MSSALPQSTSPPRQPESSYAWMRLAAALGVGTMAGAGMWTVVVALPAVQADFATDRATASLPYTMMMFGFCAGTVGFGRISDRYGVVLSIVGSAVLLCIGYVLAGLAPTLAVYALAHAAIGLGAAAGFAPLMADVSHWFVKNRGLAVVIAACGNYVAGAIWPLVMNATIPAWGWRATHIGIGLAILVVMLPLAALFRPQPEKSTLAAAEAASDAARADLGLSPNRLQFLLVFAGLGCCVAMSMPQVHIVAYCNDLGYGPARGAEMLSLMLALGIFSRIGSGLLADRIGGLATMFIGSFMQAVVLVLYIFFNGLTSLYIISGIFGLFQGGIVPMYAVIAREFMPPRQAGLRIGMILGTTILGMALGGYISGLIFDLTASYRMAFLNGSIWNLMNLAVIGWLWMRVNRRRLAAA
jgi:MFS family permease